MKPKEITYPSNSKKDVNIHMPVFFKMKKIIEISVPSYKMLSSVLKQYEVTDVMRGRLKNVKYPLGEKKSLCEHAKRCASIIKKFVEEGLASEFEELEGYTIRWMQDVVKNETFLEVRHFGEELCRSKPVNEFDSIDEKAVANEIEEIMYQHWREK